MRKKRAESRKEMVVTTVALDRDLHQRLAIAAVEDNLALTEIVRQAVREWLDRRRQTGRRKRSK